MSNLYLSDDLQARLEALAYRITDNFCYSCCQVVPGDYCPRCGTDDFMRHLDGVGVEYGTDWVIEHLIIEHCTPIDEDEEFCDLLNECSGPVKIGILEYDPGRVLKAVDPTAFHCGVVDMLADSDRYVEVDGAYYRISDIETMLDEQTETVEQD